MEEWKEYKLGEITTIIGDGLHGTPQYDSNGEYFFINGNNLVQGRIVIKSDTNKVNEQEYLKYKKPLSRKTILLSINGTIGNLALYNNEKCMLGKSACYINASDSIERDFLYYVFSNEDFQSYLIETATGTTIPNVPLKGLREYTFKYPPLPEQRAIASVLSSLDDKIDLLYRQNATLEKMAETLFRQWFAEEAKEEWEEKTINDVVSIKGGTTPSTKEASYWDGNIYWSTPKDLSNQQSVYLFETERKITEKGLSQISSGLLPKETVLLSSRAPIGYLAITEIPTAINQGYIAIVCNKIVSHYFMYLWCKFNLEEIKNSGNGSVFQEISKGVFKQLTILLPPREYLSDFNSTIEPIFQKIKINQSQIRTLTQLRNTLLPKLMSGELRI